MHLSPMGTPAELRHDLSNGAEVFPVLHPDELVDSDVPAAPAVGGGEPDVVGRNEAHFDGERSEEHTSELQSRGHLVCRLLLEKKKIEKCSKAVLHLYQ